MISERPSADGAAVLWQDGPWRLRTVSAAEKGAYDSFVGEHRHGDFLQGWAWGDMKALGGWRPWRLALERDGRWQAVASILERRLPLALGAMLYAPRGPVADYADPELTAKLVEALTEGLRRVGAIALKIDPDVPDGGDLASRLGALGVHRGRSRGLFGGIQPRHVMRLDLDRPLDAVFASFTPKCRYNIRLAQRKGVQVDEGGRDDLAVVYRLLGETAARDGFGVRDDRYYGRVFDHTVALGHGRILLARVEGETVAATWTVHFGRKAWYLFGASSARRRETMPNYLLQWEAIRWAHDRGARLYDFLGVPPTPDPSSPIIGLWRFKERFSPELVSFAGEFDLPLRPFGYLLWRLADPVYARGLVLAGRARRSLRGALGRVRGRAAGAPKPTPQMP